MVNNQKILGMLGLATKAGKIVVGAEATKEALAKQKVKLLCIATDASENTQKMWKREAEEKKIPIYTIATIEEISKRIGKHNKAIIGITDAHFAQAIQQNINGGEGIG